MCPDNWPHATAKKMERPILLFGQYFRHCICTIKETQLVGLIKGNSAFDLTLQSREAATFLFTMAFLGNYKEHR